MEDPAMPVANRRSSGWSSRILGWCHRRNLEDFLFSLALPTPCVGEGMHVPSAMHEFPTPRCSWQFDQQS